MIRIEGNPNRNVIGKRPGSARKGAGGEVFRPAATVPSRPAAPSVPVQPGAGIEAILALQGVDETGERRRNAVRHGHSMLDTLEEIKADLLVGNIGEGRLNRLMAMVGRARQQADPELEALIEDIELRARVELAKLGRFVP